MNNINVVLKNNFFIDNYNRARFYRILIDTGPFIALTKNYYKEELYE